MSLAKDSSGVESWRGISAGMSYLPPTMGNSMSAIWSLNRIDVEPEPDSGSEITLPLESLVGHALEIELFAGIRCGHCQRQSKKSYGQGYCYPCFKKLARCDLCMMAPTRCHFDAGTCREPQWAQDFLFY